MGPNWGRFEKSRRLGEIQVYGRFGQRVFTRKEEEQREVFRGYRDRRLHKVTANRIHSKRVHLKDNRVAERAAERLFRHETEATVLQEDQRD